LYGGGEGVFRRGVIGVFQKKGGRGMPKNVRGRGGSEVTYQKGGEKGEIKKTNMSNDPHVEGTFEREGALLYSSVWRGGGHLLLRRWEKGTYKGGRGVLGREGNASFIVTPGRKEGVHTRYEGGISKEKIRKALRAESGGGPRGGLSLKGRRMRKKGLPWQTCLKWQRAFGTREEGR